MTFRGRMIFRLFWVVVVFQLCIIGTAGLQCYNCINISDADECLSITECGASQSCYMDKMSSGQTVTLGCTDNQQCGVIAGAAGSLVGRGVDRRQQFQCHECCSTDKCNKNMCSHQKSGTCIDDVKVDCAYMNTFFNICQDIHHAKLVCPKFCALCSLVDGNWGRWSPWSPCEHGTQTRTRTCTDPVPAHGGLDCIGSNITTKSCSKELCPDGGWTDWGLWSTCSVMCGDGLKSRSRTCTNPLPSMNGRYCDGNPFEDAVCTKSSCSPNIVFKAKNVTNRSPGGGHVIIFGSTLVNERNAYNASTGIFTAPVNGTYSFSIQLCSNVQREIAADLMVDGTIYATLLLHDKDQIPCDSADTVAVLHGQSKVFVKCTYGCTSNALYQNRYHMNSFSGYLIYQ